MTAYASKPSWYINAMWVLIAISASCLLCRCCNWLLEKRKERRMEMEKKEDKTYNEDGQHIDRGDVEAVDVNDYNGWTRKKEEETFYDWSQKKPRNNKFGRYWFWLIGVFDSVLNQYYWFCLSSFHLFYKPQLTVCYISLTFTIHDNILTRLATLAFVLNNARHNHKDLLHFGAIIFLKL